MRLIDADALEQQLNVQYKYLEGQYGGYDHYTTGYGDALSVVEDAPTVDAVPVVRCKDCVHNELFTNGLGSSCPYCHAFGRMHINDNGYCSYGERMTGNE